MLIRKPFYFMRHGETAWNKENRRQGQTDIPLNDLGREQASNAQAHVPHHIQAVFYSPLLRAQETMLLATEHLVDCPRTALDELKEWHCGIVEGRIKDSSWPESWHVAPPGGETIPEFFDRSLRGVNKALASTDVPTLIVAHKGTFWAICHYIQTEPISLGNAQLVYVCPHGEDAWNVWVI